MALATTDIPAGLKALLAGRPALQPPNGAAAPPGFAPGSTPYPGAAPGATMPPAGATPAAAAGAAPERVPRAAGMPSDDPTFDPAFNIPLPDPGTVTNSPEMANLRRITSENQDLTAKRAALEPPSAEANKPALWKRIGTAAAGIVSPRAGAALHDLEWGKFNRAKNDYEEKSGALDKQLDFERAQLGPAEAAARTVGENFTRNLDVAKEKREQAAGGSKAGYWETRAGELKDQASKFVAGTEHEDDKSPTGWSATTFGGETKPFSPKSASAAPKPVTNATQGWYEAFKRDNKREPTAKEWNTHEISLRQAEHEKPVSPSGWSPDETREITGKGRRNLLRLTQLEKDRSMYVGSTIEGDDKRLEAIDQEIEQQHQALDAIEQEVLSHRKGAGAKPAPAAAPAAGATKDQTYNFPKDFFKGKEGRRMTVDVGGGRKVKFDIQADGTPKEVTAAGTP